MDDDVPGAAVDPGAAEPTAVDRAVADPAVAAADDARAGAATTDAVTARAVPPLWRAIVVYTGIRVGLIAGLTAIIFFAGRPVGMPLIVALAFGMVLQLPLSVVFFRQARSNLTAALARAKERRTTERDRLFAELTGEQRED